MGPLMQTVAITATMTITGKSDAIGYLASTLVFASFVSVSMIPLRIFGILSNVAFILYGLQNHLAPVLALHAVLLPVNLWRLVQLKNRRLGNPDGHRSPGRFTGHA